MSSSITLLEIKEFVANHKFDNKSFKLNDSEVITNKEKFANSHLKMILAQSGNKTF